MKIREIFLVYISIIIDINKIIYCDYKLIATCGKS